MKASTLSVIASTGIVVAVGAVAFSLPKPPSPEKRADTVAPVEVAPTAPSITLSPKQDKPVEAPVRPVEKTKAQSGVVVHSKPAKPVEAILASPSAMSTPNPVQVTPSAKPKPVETGSSGPVLWEEPVEEEAQVDPVLVEAPVEGEEQTPVEEEEQTPVEVDPVDEDRDAIPVEPDIPQVPQEATEAP